jgi:hypothetical protein
MLTTKKRTIPIVHADRHSAWMLAGLLLCGLASTGAAQLTQGPGLRLTGPGLPWIDVRAHGAKGNGIHDDAASIGDAIALAQKQVAKGLKPRLLFPPAVGYLVGSTISVPPGISVEMYGPLLFSGSDSSPCLVIGTPGQSNPDLSHRLVVHKIAVSDWQDEGSVGVTLLNAFTSRIEAREIFGFTIGLACVGSGKGFAANQVELGRLQNNHIGLDLTNESVVTYGWCNENLFLNGEIAIHTNVHPDLSRYGVRITSRDGTYPNNNNNLFVKTSIELRADVQTSGEAIPVLIEQGVQNRFESARNDFNGPIFARVLGDSAENEFDIGFGLTPLVEDLSSAPTSIIASRRSRLRDTPGSALFLSGPLVRRACVYETTPMGIFVNVAGLHGCYSSAIAPQVGTQDIVIGADHVEVPMDRALGVFVDTSHLKRFVVRRDAQAGYGGRLMVRCYDALGNVLQDPGTGSPPLVTGLIFAVPFWSGMSFGGTYKQGSDGDDDFFFRVTDEVQQVAVLFSGGIAELRLKSFALFSVDGGNARVWPGYEEGIPGANRAVEAPQSGTWLQGRIVYNDQPQPAADLGWICVQGGTPGVWKSIGKIAN